MSEVVIKKLAALANFTHEFAQNKKQFKGYTVFDFKGIEFITLMDAKAILRREVSKK